MPFHKGSPILAEQIWSRCTSTSQANLWCACIVKPFDSHWDVQASRRNLIKLAGGLLAGVGAAKLILPKDGPGKSKDTDVWQV